MEQENQKSAFTLALMANVLWASSFVGSKYTLLAWGPCTAVFLRFILSFVVLFIAYKIFGVDVRLPNTKRQWSMIFLIGLILGALYPLQLTGLKYINTGVSAAIMLLSPILLICLGPILNKETFDGRKIVAVFVGAIGGLVLLSENFKDAGIDSVGVWLTLAAALCLALFTIVTKKASGSVKHTTITLYSFAVGSVILAPFAYSEALTPMLSKTDFSTSLGALIYLVIACTTIPFFIWNRATEMTDTKNLASTMHVKTPVAIILGVIIFGESVTWRLVAGTALVSYALWLSQKGNIHLFLRNKKGVNTYEREPLGSAALRKIH